VRFQQYLTEARDTTKGKGVTWDEIKNIQTQLKRMIRPDMTQQISTWKGKDGEWWDLSFRAYDFYTSRPGEEDDDWPEFTGYKKLLKMITPVLKGIGYSIQDSEKSWFSINVKVKKPTKKDQRADSRKEKEKVWWALRDGERRADRYEKEKYNETADALKKLKTKFIKKDKFYELAKKINWRWDQDDLDNFWRDIK